MSIPIEQESEPDFRCRERCCFCRSRTIHWTTIATRTPGQQVACCPPCAEAHEEAEVPTKREWCDKEGTLTRRPWEVV